MSTIWLIIRVVLVDSVTDVLGDVAKRSPPVSLVDNATRDLIHPKMHANQRDLIQHPLAAMSLVDFLA
jgi:hypothetical protein